MHYLAINWFEHRRTSELCAGLELPLRTIATKRRGILRYIELTLRTVRALSVTRPKTLLVQNPSLVLALLAVALRAVFRYRLVVDAHNEAIQPVINRGALVLAVTNLVLRSADLTIVTNRFLADIVASRGGRPFVLPDRVPSAPRALATALTSSFNLVLICTYAEDEPVAEVFEAVRDLDVRLYVTGNDRKCEPALRQAAPSNVVLTGFLSETDYWGYLNAADAIIDLTTMPNCLVCGGYEAMAIEKPLLLSRSDAACELFGDAALYTDNTVSDIRQRILDLMQQAATLRAQMLVRREQLEREWASAARRLHGLMEKRRDHEPEVDWAA